MSKGLLGPPAMESIPPGPQGLSTGTEGDEGLLNGGNPPVGHCQK